MRPFPVIDADGHVIERDHELREFLPDPTGGAQGKRRYALFPWNGWARGGLAPHRREHPDPARWIGFLDACGITATVLYPSDGLRRGQGRGDCPRLQQLVAPLFSSRKLALPGSSFVASARSA